MNETEGPQMGKIKELHVYLSSYFLISYFNICSRIEESPLQVPVVHQPQRMRINNPVLHDLSYSPNSIAKAETVAQIIINRATPYSRRAGRPPRRRRGRRRRRAPARGRWTERREGSTPATA